jgi:hypothetical protein
MPENRDSRDRLPSRLSLRRILPVSGPRAVLPPTEPNRPAAATTLPIGTLGEPSASTAVRFNAAGVAGLPSAKRMARRARGGRTQAGCGVGPCGLAAGTSCSLPPKHRSPARSRVHSWSRLAASRLLPCVSLANRRVPLSLTALKTTHWRKRYPREPAIRGVPTCG